MKRTSGSPRSLHLGQLALVVATAGLGTAVSAETAAGGAAASGSFTSPLPSPDLPRGALTVKVVRQSMGRLAVGQQVHLEREDGSNARIQTSMTGEDGRARFDGLAADARYHISLTLPGGQELRSATFNGPAEGGLRLLATLGAPDGSALPEGMRSGELPPGHPPLPAGATGPPAPQAGSPTSARAPSGMMGPVKRADEGDAVIAAAPDLPAGQVRALVRRGRAGTPLGDALVTATAPGKGQRPRASARTDARGEAALPLPEGESVLTVTHQGLAYRSRTLSAPSQGGLRVTFVVYDRSRDRSRLVVSSGSHLVLQVGEGAVSFMQVLQLANRGDAIFDPGPDGLELTLPRGATNPEVPEEDRALFTVEEDRGLLRWRAPLAPGTTAIRYFFEIPYQGAQLSYEQVTPIPFEESKALILGSSAVTLVGAGVQDAPREKEGGGERSFVLAPVRKGGLLQLTLAALPHRDRSAALATLALAGALVLWAALAAWSGPQRWRRRHERREELLRELLTLRRSPRSQSEAAARRRDALQQELGRIWDES